MYYLLLLLLFVVLYYVFVKVLSSIVKGCFTAFFIVFVVFAVYVMLKSTKESVNLFGLNRLTDLKLERIK